MTGVPVFHARISTEGHFQLAEEERDRRRAYFQTLAGQRVEIVVRKERTKRSIDQNAYLHAVPFWLISEHTGYTVPEVKLLLMGECFGWKTISGHEIPVKPNTSDMTVHECSQFIEWLIPWAMETLGVPIPLPNEVAA